MVERTLHAHARKAAAVWEVSLPYLPGGGRVEIIFQFFAEPVMVQNCAQNRINVLDAQFENDGWRPGYSQGFFRL